VETLVKRGFVYFKL